MCEKRSPESAKAKRLYNEFESKYNHMPNYATCIIAYKDGISVFEDIISFKEYNEDEDESIFFYCIDLEELIDLMDEDNDEDFVIKEVVCFK